MSLRNSEVSCDFHVAISCLFLPVSALPYDVIFMKGDNPPKSARTCEKLRLWHRSSLLVCPFNFPLIECSSVNASASWSAAPACDAHFGANCNYPPPPHLDAHFLLTTGSFLLTAEFLCLQLFGALLCLQWKLNSWQSELSYLWPELLCVWIYIYIYAGEALGCPHFGRFES